MLLLCICICIINLLWNYVCDMRHDYMYGRTDATEKETATESGDDHSHTLLGQWISSCRVLHD